MTTFLCDIHFHKETFNYKCNFVINHVEMYLERNKNWIKNVLCILLNYLVGYNLPLCFFGSEITWTIYIMKMYNEKLSLEQVKINRIPCSANFIALNFLLVM